MAISLAEPLALVISLCLFRVCTVLEMKIVQRSPLLFKKRHFFQSVPSHSRPFSHYLLNGVITFVFNQEIEPVQIQDWVYFSTFQGQVWKACPVLLWGRIWKQSLLFGIKIIFCLHLYRQKSSQPRRSQWRHSSIPLRSPSYYLCLFLKIRSHVHTSSNNRHLSAKNYSRMLQCIQIKVSASGTLWLWVYYVHQTSQYVAQLSEKAIES